jgi:hypothetical protein
MCFDYDTIYTMFSVAEGLMLASLIACGLAVAANLGVFTSFTVPITFAVALGCRLAASLVLAPITMMLANCQSPQCISQVRDAAQLFGLVTGTLATAIAAAYIAQAISAVSFAGATQMGVYAVLLGLASAGLINGISVLQTLQNCEVAKASAAAATVAIILGFTVASVGMIGLFLLLISGLGSKPKGPKN